MPQLFAVFRENVVQQIVVYEHLLVQINAKLG